MTLRLPSAVTENGRIYVTHAAGPVAREALETGVATIEQAGFIVDRNSTLGVGPPELPFLAGTDRARARDLVHGLTAPDYNAVIAARGGYGAMRLLNRLPQEMLWGQDRWLIGYSDITALHLWAFQQGVATIHGPMVAGFAKENGTESLQSLIAALRRQPSALPVEGDRAASGRLIGGNLSLLAALRPTKFWPDLTGCLLFIEEVGEPLYRIDRALETLHLAGGLQAAAGFVIGQCARCGVGENGSDQAVALIRSRLQDLGRPVLAGATAGHGLPNLSFIHGARYEFHAGALQFAERETTNFPTVLRSSTKPYQTLCRAVAAGICSGTQLVASRRGEVIIDESVGHRSDNQATQVSSATPFDLASVTKAICTAILAHRAIEEERVALEDRCPGNLSVARPTLRSLLHHASGLPAHVEVFRRARRADDPTLTAERAFAALNATESEPVYSDVGYIALGRWLAALFGEPLDRVFLKYIAKPLRLATQFGPVENAAATERCVHRHQVLRGIVHDENAQALGGVAGHAGLFGTAQDVDTIARSLLGYGPSILSPRSVARMWDPTEKPKGGTYTLGWDTPSGPRSNAGSLMSRDASVGHLGFTGTSLWIDRDREIAISLLTNRVHPSRVSAGIRWLRPAIHDAVVKELS